jgi:hypothetical protein
MKLLQATLGISSSGSSASFPLLSGVFTAEEFEEAGDKGSGEATLFVVMTFLQAF